MNRICKLFLFCIGFLATLEARQIELHFNQTVEEDFLLHFPVNDQTPLSWSEYHPEYAPSSNQKLIIENKGDQVLENCLPFINQPSFYTLDELNQEIRHSNYPLLALYQLWNRSLCPSSIAQDFEDPFQLLNFGGGCTQKQWIDGFVKLCSLMNIAVRPAGVHNKQGYDFCWKNHWYFLDLQDEQFYLSLDNKTLISSEEVMDDPILAIRTKHHRKAPQMNLKKSWETLAHFEILIPYLAEQLSKTSVTPFIPKKKGFDLYPNEQLIYEAQPLTSWNLPSYQLAIQHVITPATRQVGNELSYTSPCPIKAICNNTSHPLLVKELSETIQPGESLTLPDLTSFTLHLVGCADSAGSLTIYSQCASRLFPTLTKGLNHIHLGSIENSTLIDLTYDIEEDQTTTPHYSLQVINNEQVFDYCTPYFQLYAEIEQPIETIWWQISTDSTFQFIPANFEQIEPFTSEVRLSLLTDTFFNPDEQYYFRVKGCINGKWGDWSNPFAFTVKKPQTVKTIEFEKIDDNTYQLSWKQVSEEAEYLIFGSNSLDFVPSIYGDVQVNAILNGEVIDEEFNENLIAMTRDTKWLVDGSLAYYRLIVREKGQFSVPSPLIHVYDHNLKQVRTVLQMIETGDQQVIAKRSELPSGYEWIETACHPIPFPTKGHLLAATQFFRSYSSLPTLGTPLRHYTPNPHVAPEIWETVKPYFLPENHPVKPKLDRMFSKTRVTLTSETFKKEGFKRNKPGTFNRVMASSNPNLPGYFIKAFADTELTIQQDWQKWINRIEGAKSIKECIRRNGYQSLFKVPNKWIYPLPIHPSPPRSSKYLRKNFILVAEDMRIYDHDTNEKKYHDQMSHKRLKALYTVLQEEGLYDSVYAFNIPFSKDGKMAFIDTEHHHKWPVPFHKFNRYFSSETQKYWKKLIETGDSYQKPKVK